MASNLTDEKNENLSREELVKKLNYIESTVLAGKNRIIHGQNKTIQTLTAQNLMFRELLKKVLDLKIGLFGHDELTKLQKVIQDKLNGIVINNQNNSTENLTEQNVILRDLIEQFLSMKIGLFNIRNVANFQTVVRSTFDKLHGR